METQAIRWSPTNFLGAFDNRWVLESASIDAGILTIQAGGKATLILTSEVNAEFKYIKLVNVFSSLGVSSANNYQNKPTVFVQEVYKDSNDKPDRVKIRSIGFNTVNEIETDKYQDETIYQTLDRKMQTLKLILDNETDTVLTIYNISMYQSQDISETQVKDTVSPMVNSLVNSVVSAGAAEDIKVYRNADGSVQGLGVFIQGATTELKFRPSYFNGQLIAIDTNFGQTVSIQNIQELIDLTTS